MQGNNMDAQTKLEIEAATLSRLLNHLDERKDVQNIDIMILAGFCRNCLAKWYKAAAAEKGFEMTYDEAQEVIYGMPYSEWKSKYQEKATPEQLAAYEAAPKARIY